MAPKFKPREGMIVRVRPQGGQKVYPAIITGVHSWSRIDLVAFHHEDFKTHGPHLCTEPFFNVQHRTEFLPNDLHLHTYWEGNPVQAKQK